MIQLKNVTKSYPAREEENNGGLIKALDDISLSIEPGEWVAMMGPSGSGKSTMVNLIGCLDRPTSGEIWLDGQNVASLSASDLNHVRAETIGFVFQQFHMIPYLTAVENVMLAQYFHSMTDEKEALEALERVGLKDRAGHLPSQLSGGEQQRVCIARALINDPKIVLADEPTGNLDAVNEEIVLRLLRELHQQGRTIVMVTHDPVVARLADRRIELHHGKIAAQEVFAMADEEQFDEVLEELFALEENGQIAEIGRMEVHGALPVSLAVEKMAAMELVTMRPHPLQAHDHKPFVNPCHDALKPAGFSTGDGSAIVELTPRGHQRAADIIRRHRLAERLFTDSLAMDSETEIEQQACKFEHILSPEATDKICTFLNHPRTCPTARPFRRGPAADAAPNRGARPLYPYALVLISYEGTGLPRPAGRSAASTRLPGHRLLLPKEFPKPQPHLHRIHSRIRHGQPGVRNVHVPDIHRPRMLPKKIHPERRARREVYRRSSRRHFMRRKQRSSTQLEVGSNMSARGENPFQPHRIHSSPVHCVCRLEYNKRRHRVHRQLESSVEKSRPMGSRQNPPIANSRVPHARILGPARNRAPAASPNLKLTAALLRAILRHRQRNGQKHC